MKKQKSSFSFIDLFAGIGGIRLAFERQGGTCVFSSEWNKFAQKSYEAMHGDAPEGDITKINEKDLPDFDLLLGGFPCQAFSQAGKKQGFLDTRGTMFFEIERILKEKKPKAFLLENVKGLKSHDKGRTLSVILESLKNLGYHVKFEVLSAKDFGLPQNRPRIYLVGFLSEKSFDMFSFPAPLGLKTSLGSILEKKVDPKYTISDKLWAGHKRRLLEHAEKGNGFGYSMFNKKSPYTSTLSARYYKDGSEILIEQKDKNPRKLTPVEAGRLQGFPDDLIKKAMKAGVSDNQLYKQLGNSVAVNVIEEIAKKIVHVL